MELTKAIFFLILRFGTDIFLITTKAIFSSNCRHPKYFKFRDVILLILEARGDISYQFLNRQKKKHFCSQLRRHFNNFIADEGKFFLLILEAISNIFHQYLWLPINRDKDDFFI